MEPNLQSTEMSDCKGFVYTKVLVNDIFREDSGVKLESFNCTNSENFRLELPVGITLDDEKLQISVMP